ncbi:glycoside hydrolase family protein [Flavobacterium daejeonense]|uniref:hypothetical protein n=1 Tax=Flavobacterium daejeonense TaxID=350893 RepID=UPI00047DE299|nr:hypothetical protein [Flavobacterium daejeonense]
MEVILELINERIAKHASVTRLLNFENGKLGFCFYFFELATIEKSPKHLKLATNLFEQIRRELPAYSANNFVYELAQIGIAIDLFVKRDYIHADINRLLEDFDDLIFKKLLVLDLANIKPFETVIILYYLCIRIEKQKKESDACFILEELCILTFNNFYQTIDSSFFDEPLSFSLTYQLPLFIFILSKLYGLGFYNYRFDAIIKEVSGLILSRLPVLHSNRLYLLWSLTKLKEATNSIIWDEQIEILTQHINCEKIIFEELRSKNIAIRDGLAGVYLLLNELSSTINKIQFDVNWIKEKLKDSELWKNNRWATSNLGLVNGLSGVILVYSLIKTNNQ